MSYREWTNDEIRGEIARRMGWIIVNYETWVGVPNASGVKAYQPCPNWPADIAAAWRLVEELKNRAIYIHWSVFPPSDELSWGVGVLYPTEPAGGEWYKITFAPTAPRAICEAWLQATETWRNPDTVFIPMPNPWGPEDEIYDQREG